MNADAPGQWPVDEPVDLVPQDMYLQRAAENARHELILDNIKAHLAEQPTANSVLTVGRRYCADITAAAEKIARAKRSTS